MGPELPRQSGSEAAIETKNSTLGSKISKQEERKQDFRVVRETKSDTE